MERNGRRGPARKERGRHHHGDLRAALVEAAWVLVEEGGVAELTLRSVAARVGVTAMAPYHHFANKSALVAAVATRGFERLREAMLARAAREARRLLKLRALGVAYAVFAVRHPEVFRVMFGPELADPRDHPALAEAASRTMEALVAGFGGASDAGEIGPVRAERAALTSWAAMHGLATLVISGQLGPVTEANAVKLALMVTDGLRAGLGPSSTAGPPA